METAPYPVEQDAQQGDDLFHFGCSAERLRARATGTSVRCLCGTVQDSDAVGAKHPSLNQRCVVCVDLAPAHFAECKPCNRKAKR